MCRCEGVWGFVGIVPEFWVLIFADIRTSLCTYRYGFNSDGHEAVHARLSQLQPPGQRSGILGVNLGKNKTSEDYVQDYTQGIAQFGPIADYLVVNISR